MTERPILFSAPMIRALLAGTKTQTRRVCKNQPYPNGYKFDGRDFLCHNDYLPPSAMLMDGGRGKLRWTTSDVEGWESECPYGLAGDQLWVREAWTFAGTLDPGILVYRADYPACVPRHYENVPPESALKWRPSIHLARDQSRIQLEVTGVRVERLQDISEDDAVAEGCKADVPETWWQGYKDCGGSMGWIHQQATGDEPPDWMIEPHKMAPTPHLVRSAKWHYELLWDAINGPGSWEANPWVWVVEFRRLNP